MNRFYAVVLFLFAFYKISSAQWQQLNMPTTKDIVSSSFVSDDEGWIGTANSGSYATIFHTTDGGNTWSNDTIDGASGGTSYVEFVNSSLGFAVVNKHAFKTTNAGQTWTEMTLPDDPYNEPYFLNADTGFISGDGESDYLFKTVDGGETWATAYMEEGEGDPFNKIDFLNDSLGIATASGDETAYITSDGGNNWYLLKFSTFLYYTSACFSKLGSQYISGYEDYGFGIEDVWILSDHGWYDEYYNYDCIPNDVASFENGRVYGVGECGLIVHTEDNGFKWKDTVLTSGELTLVDGINDIYVFGKSGKGFKRPYYCSTAAIFSFSANDLDVSFTDQSSNATSWSWDFGDGGGSSDQNPSHTYTNAGSYNVCLAVTGPCGSDTLCYSIIICASNSSQSYEGSLDPTFANNGILIDSVGYYEAVYTLRILPDGKILACDGDYYENIVRYKTDGTRDSSFSDDGIIYEGYLSNSSSYQNRLALAQDGRIAFCRRNQNDIQINCYNSDGSIDSSFDGDGKVIKDLSQTHNQDWVISSAFQSDGKLLVHSNAFAKSSVARFNANGSLDSSFAGDGIFNSQSLIGYDNGINGDLIVQDDGKIVIGVSNNESDSYYFLMRIHANGTIDSSFGNDGIVKANFISNTYPVNSLYSILIQPDGKYIAAGTGMYESLTDYQWRHFYSLARFNPDGTPDTSFGFIGRDTFQINSQESYGTDAELEDDGKILITGYYGFYPDKFKIGLLRLNIDGTIDSSFGNYGIVTTTQDCGNTKSYAIALDSNKIYVGGVSPRNDFFIARYHLGCVPISPDFISSIQNLIVQFNDQSSGATSWSWNFGDGNFSSDQNPSHTYAEEGTYSICLSVADSCGGNNSVCKSVTVCELLNTDYLFYEDNLEVHFSNLVNTADSAYWDFGDGVTSTLTSPTHDYDYAGTYAVCLYEFDVCGDADTMCKDITVCGQLESNFSYSPNGNSVQFTDLSENTEGRTWNFGDGFTDTLKNPTHIYDLPGDYNACIHSFNECEGDSMCQLVNIIATGINFTSDASSFSVYPNPFSSSTTIDFFLKESSQAAIKLFSVDGKEVMTIRDENFSKGKHAIDFSRKSLAAGIYFLRLETVHETFNSKLILE